MKLLYRIDYQGGGGKVSEMQTLTVGRPGAQTPLVLFHVNTWGAPAYWESALSDGPVVFQDDALPVVVAGPNVDWRFVLHDPEDKYRSLQMWGREGRQESATLIASPPHPMAPRSDDGVK